MTSPELSAPARCLRWIVAAVLVAGGAGLFAIIPASAAEPGASASQTRDAERGAESGGDTEDENNGDDADSREPLDVLIVGDSFGDGLWLGLRSRWGDRDDIELHRHSETASGLVRLDYFDWLSNIDDICDGESYDAALVIFGANDVQMLRTDDGDRVHFMSEAWRREYRSRVATFTRKIKSSVDSVYWVGLPILREGAPSAQKLNEIYESEAEDNDIAFLSLWEWSSDDDGDFAEYADVGHTRRRIRLDDGVHFTTYGYRYLVSPVSERLLEDFDREDEDGGSQPGS